MTFFRFATVRSSSELKTASMSTSETVSDGSSVPPSGISAPAVSSTREGELDLAVRPARRSSRSGSSPRCRGAAARTRSSTVNVTRAWPSSPSAISSTVPAATPPTHDLLAADELARVLELGGDPVGVASAAQQDQRGDQADANDDDRAAAAIAVRSRVPSPLFARHAVEATQGTVAVRQSTHRCKIQTIVTVCSGSICVVTGGGRGIGRATARALARRGARVAIGDLDLEAGEAAAAEVGAAGAFELDVANPRSWDAFVTAVERELGPVEILVSNAGVMGVGRFAADPVEVALRQVEINLKGVMLGVHRVLPGMLERRSGHLVNVASAAGKTAYAGGAAYCASKHGVVGFSEALRDELLDTGVGISLVMPGPVQTELISGLDNPPGVRPVAARRGRHGDRRRDRAQALRRLRAEVDRRRHEGDADPAPARRRSRPGRGRRGHLPARGRSAVARRLRGRSAQDVRTPTVAIVGAGMSGLCVGAKLKRAGIEDFTIHEKAAAIGGTWRDNTYPGLSCDVPSHFYQYVQAARPLVRVLSGDAA